jgi:hypothetical protein
MVDGRLGGMDGRRCVVGLDDQATLRAMDGLVRSVGDGISGLVGGAISAIAAALAGIGDALTSAIPPGLLPVAGVAVVALVVVALIRR